MGAVQLIFIGFIGEYILSMNQRIMKRPLVIEEGRYHSKEGSENVEQDRGVC